ncbi:hypothetical protein CRENBAI_001085 [Crenichthys baileyi]|uniref:Uncharacterized protein n=1 Tax=Crenichthys baileyi TaxID=28760 RepID=A0AAV9QR66_9TELE
MKTQPNSRDFTHLHLICMFPERPAAFDFDSGGETGMALSSFSVPPEWHLVWSSAAVAHPPQVVRRYPVFLGRPHRTWLRQEPLHIQRIIQVNRTLYIGARDDLFRVELDNSAGDEMFYSKKRTWESNKNDIRICRMKGKHERPAAHALPEYLYSELLSATHKQHILGIWREHLTLNLYETVPDRGTMEDRGTKTKKLRLGEGRRRGVCESLLADPEEGCGADGDMKGLLAPNDCAVC